MLFPFDEEHAVTQQDPTPPLNYELTNPLYHPSYKISLLRYYSLQSFVADLIRRLFFLAIHTLYNLSLATIQRLLSLDLAYHAIILSISCGAPCSPASR